jgi:hypothetical protein
MDTRLSYKEVFHNYRSLLYIYNHPSIFYGPSHLFSRT